ncbi:nuclear transport factor 2 family protein [Bradyrhizobium manausense]|uniref:nuclear transport factor 2 family protein n=1 Tax=Bradyrhizobium manausense TaxID=989370 RepID=UPI0020128AAE|nr:nuclear transport factor 2 family protein [Bradyrhizobium manausense]
MIDMVVRNMSCDPMAAAVDWLDAYRAGDIEAILAMYAEDAVVHCDCDGMKTLTGPEALRAYWVDRLRRHPASALDNLQPSGDGTEISYITGTGLVSAILAFDRAGKIKTLSCGPSN